MTPKELHEMAEHVQYEIDQFRNAIRRLDVTTQSDAGWNSAIELALLHFRNLRDFFFPENARSDDVFARDYIATWSPLVDPVFKETRNGINKRLAHLTLARRIPWNAPLKKMNTAIETLIAEFKRQLTREQANWFSRLELQTVIVLGATSYSTVSVSHSGILLPYAPDEENR
jgi:hypothetical protein